MIKQVIILIALSVLVVFAASYAQEAIQALLKAHEWIAQILTEVFSGGQVGNLLRGLIALLSIPILIASIPAAFYWMVRRHFFPYFLEIVWVVWLIQAGALMVITKVAV